MEKCKLLKRKYDIIVNEKKHIKNGENFYC